MKSQGPRGGRAKRDGRAPPQQASPTAEDAIIFAEQDKEYPFAVGRIVEAILPAAILRQLGRVIVSDHRFHITLDEGHNIVFGVVSLQPRPDGSRLAFLRIHEVTEPGAPMTQLVPRDWSVGNGEPEPDAIHLHPMDMKRSLRMGELIEFSAPPSDRDDLKEALQTGQPFESLSPKGRLQAYRVCSVLIKPDGRPYVVARLVKEHLLVPTGIA